MFDKILTKPSLILMANGVFVFLGHSTFCYISIHNLNLVDPNALLVSIVPFEDIIGDHGPYLNKAFQLYALADQNGVDL